MIRYVCGFCFSTDKTHVALIKKLKPQWQANKFNGIGGKRDLLESPKEAMSREFEEETGVFINPDEWIKQVFYFSFKNYEIDFFYTFNDKVFDCRTTEKEEVYVIDLSTLHNYDVIPNLKWLIPLCLDPYVQNGINIKDIGGN